MKTPRDLLLRHHQAAVPKLDRLRAEVLSAIQSRSRRREETHSLPLNNSRESGAIQEPRAGAPSIAWHGQAKSPEAEQCSALQTFRRSLPAFAMKLWRELIWPCRRAWTGLAAVWLGLLIVNVSTTDSTQLAAKSAVIPSPEMLMALREQRRLLSELVQPWPTETPKPPKPAAPAPRSEGMSRTVSA